MAPAARLARLSAALGVRPDERRRVLLLAIYSVAAVGGVLTIGYQGVAMALFVGRLPSSAIPLTLILPGVSILIATLIYNRALAHFPLAQVVQASTLLLGLIGLGMWLVLALDHTDNVVVLGTLFMWCETASTITVIQFWMIASHVFDTRQARRLFGLIATGGILAVVAAGLSLATLTGLFGVENLLIITVVSLGICGLCARALARDVVAPTGAGSARENRPLPLLGDLQAIARSPLLQAIAGLTLLLSLIVNIALYQFLLGLNALYAGRDDALAVFLGTFSLWAGLAALVVQLVVARRVMVQRGAFVALCFLPLAVGAGAIMVLFSGGALWALALTRAADPVLRRTMNDPSLSALYLPVPAIVRRQARAMVEGGYALTFALAGVAFLVIQRVPGWTYVQWSWPLLAVCLGWFALLFWSRPQYVRAVVDALQRRRLSFEHLRLDMTDETTARLLIDGLHSSDESRVLHMLQVLGDAPPGAWTQHLVPLLDHPSADVRILALRAIGRAGDPVYGSDVGRLLQASEPAVREAALRAFAALDQPDLPGRAAPLLDDPNPDVVATAAIALMENDRAGWQQDVAAVAGRMLRSEQPRERRAAARVLSAIRLRGIEPSLVSFLGGDDAPLTTDDARDAAVVNELVRMLDDPASWTAAAEGLVLCGTVTLSALSSTLADGTHAEATRVRAVRVVQRIGGPPSAELLVTHLADANPAVRAACCRALAQLRTAHHGGTVDEAVLDGQTVSELRDAYLLYVTRFDLDADAASLVRYALDERLAASLERVLLLVEAEYPDRGVGQARLALQARDPVNKSLAIELLDGVGGRIHRLLVPMLEAEPGSILAVGRAQFAITCTSAEARLSQLIRGSDAWLTACAIHEAGRRRLSQLAPLVLEALDSPDAVVNEAAMAACVHLLDAEHLARVARAEMRAARSPLLLRYVRAHTELLQPGGAHVRAAASGDTPATLPHPHGRR
jgi:ATP:ADP antiporter, AAA family